MINFCENLRSTKYSYNNEGYIWISQWLLTVARSQCVLFLINITLYSLYHKEKIGSVICFRSLHSNKTIRKQRLKVNSEKEDHSFCLEKYLVRDIEPLNNQSCFPQIFQRIFLSKKKPNFSIVRNQEKNLFWTKKKFVFFFNCSSWEKFVEKNWVKQDWLFGVLMSRTR